MYNSGFFFLHLVYDVLRQTSVSFGIRYYFLFLRGIFINGTSQHQNLCSIFLFNSRSCITISAAYISEGSRLVQCGHTQPAGGPLGGGRPVHTFEPVSLISADLTVELVALSNRFKIKLVSPR